MRVAVLGGVEVGGVGVRVRREAVVGVRGEGRCGHCGWMGKMWRTEDCRGHCGERGWPYCRCYLLFADKIFRS